MMFMMLLTHRTNTLAAALLDGGRVLPEKQRRHQRQQHLQHVEAAAAESSGSGESRWPAGSVGGRWGRRRFIPSSEERRRRYSGATPDTWAEKLENLERINSILEIDGSINPVAHVNAWLPAVHMSYMSFVSRIEFICSKYWNFSVHVPGVSVSGSWGHCQLVGVTRAPASRPLPSSPSLPDPTPPLRRQMIRCHVTADGAGLGCRVGTEWHLDFERPDVSCILHFVCWPSMHRTCGWRALFASSLSTRGFVWRF